MIHVADANSLCEDLRKHQTLQIVRARTLLQKRFANSPCEAILHKKLANSPWEDSVVWKTFANGLCDGPVLAPSNLFQPFSFP